MQLLTIADLANKYSRIPTWSEFTPEAYANNVNIPGNMPLGYVIHLVKIGRVDLNGLIEMGFEYIFEGKQYIFTKSNEFPNTLQLNLHSLRNNTYINIFLENITFDDFMKLPSFPESELNID